MCQSICSDERMPSNWTNWKRTKTVHSRVLIDRLDIATYIFEHQTSWNPENKAFWKMMSHLYANFWLENLLASSSFVFGRLLSIWKGLIFRDYGSFWEDSFQAEQFCLPKILKSPRQNFQVLFQNLRHNPGMVFIFASRMLQIIERLQNSTKCQLLTFSFGGGGKPPNKEIKMDIPNPRSIFTGDSIKSKQFNALCFDQIP